MRCILTRPGHTGEVVEIANDLKALQREVGGYIEIVPITIGIVAIVNEEGRIRGLAPNVLGLVGNVLFVGDDGEDFRSLTEGEISSVWTAFDWPKKERR